MILAEILNITFIYVFILYAYKKYTLPNDVILFLFFHSIIIFLTNGFLFDINYMPDQIKYLNNVIILRENFFLTSLETSFTVNSASYLFSLFPIPIIESVYSLSIINFSLFTIIFIFFYQNGILRNFNKWFYLLYPSLALYAATGLRDMIIFTITIFSIYLLSKNKIFFSFILSCLLLFVKPQNFIIYFFALSIYRLFFQKTNLFEKIFYIIFGLIFVYLSGNYLSIENINLLRNAMFREDGGESIDYINILSYTDLFKESFLGFFYFLLKPFIWESKNLFQLIQSIENIFILILLILIISKRIFYKIKSTFLIFLDIYFITAISIYGVIVFNYGTAARYRFVFICIYIIFSLYEIRKKENK